MRYKYVLYGLFCCFVMPISFAWAKQKEIDPLRFLPDTSTLQTFSAVDEPETALRHDLFELINGGAELFVQAGFERAIVQEYEHDSGGIYEVEIYQMSSVKAAKNIFAKKTGGGGVSVALSEKARLFDYYCMIRRGAFFISITGPVAAENVKARLKSLAESVVSALPYAPISKDKSH